MKLNCGCHAEYDSEYGRRVIGWTECPLHAAAPELLVVLKALADVCEPGRGDGLMHMATLDGRSAWLERLRPIRLQARAAIAKAEGEMPR